ncbi:MAG: chromate transporter [Bacteroidetes bacterium]|nr:chromate transporter [Bacteroidota bacterium]
MLTTLFKLFVSFLKVGSFSFGGAYSLLPLIEREAVTNNAWLTQDEFLKVLGMVEVFPGAISIKFATYVGYKTAGISGAIAANLGNLIMPAAIIMLASYFYSTYEKNEYAMKAFRGIKYAVIGLVTALIYQYGAKNFEEFTGIFLILLGFALAFFLNLHPAYVVIISAIVALVIL